MTLAPCFRVIDQRNSLLSMEMSFFAACPWPRPGMQRLSSMDYTTALLQFPYNAPAKSRQGRPLTVGLSVPRKSGHASNADLTMIRHGGRCPDLSGPAGALRIENGKKRYLHAHSPVSFKELNYYEIIFFNIADLCHPLFKQWQAGKRSEKVGLSKAN